jgi:hypothetical protein
MEKVREALAQLRWGHAALSDAAKAEVEEWEAERDRLAEALREMGECSEDALGARWMKERARAALDAEKAKP